MMHIILACVSLSAGAAAVGDESAAATQPAATQPAATQPAATQPAASNVQSTALPSARRIWRESLTPPKTEVSVSLQKAIDELRRMRIPPHRRPITTRPAAAPRQPAAAATQPATQPAAATTRPAGSGRALPKKVVERLKNLSPDSLREPVALADELFATGYLAGAHALYERALSRNPDDETKAWALYQMAGCLRQSDPPAAELLYLRVKDEHGGTVWAMAADVEYKILAWRRTNKLDELLRNVRQLGRQLDREATTQPQATTRPGTPVAAKGK